MASEKITNILDLIDALSIIELSELVEGIQEKYGVSAVVAAAPAAGGAAGGAAEKTEFDVVHTLLNFLHTANHKLEKYLSAHFWTERYLYLVGLALLLHHADF